MSALLQRIRWKLVPARFQGYQQRLSAFVEKVGLEIGGPSAIFKSRGIFPVYSVAERIDNCVFGAQTVWAGQVRAATNGTQFVTEGTELKFAGDEDYDFVLSSHMLEHTANPLKALKEWSRVLKRGGRLFLVVPEQVHTFDHQRPVTTLDHLISDFEKGTDESDLTHLEEILSMHDLSRDPLAGSVEEFKARSLRNFDNRCLHHHVFDAALIEKLLHYAGFKVSDLQFVPPYHLATLAERSN